MSEYGGTTIPTGTGPTIPTDAPPVPIRGLALASARRATSSAQEAALTLAEIVLGQMNSTVPLDKVGEIRIKFDEPATDVPIEFPGPGEVVILDTQGECVAIYRILQARRSHAPRSAGRLGRTALWASPCCSARTSSCIWRERSRFRTVWAWSGGFSDRPRHFLQRPVHAVGCRS